MEIERFYKNERQHGFLAVFKNRPFPIPLTLEDGMELLLKVRWDIFSEDFNSENDIERYVLVTHHTALQMLEEYGLNTVTFVTPTMKDILTLEVFTLEDIYTKV